MADITCGVQEDGSICGRAVYARSFCSKHYARWRTTGDPLLKLKRGPLRVVDPALRFWPKVDKHGPISEHAPELGPCWIWTAWVSPRNGYGTFGFGRRNNSGYAHRWSYEQANGPVPEGLELDHLCRVRHCVNPAHLEAVTHAENVRRAAAFVTCCPQGHPYNDTNTYIGPNGKRRCRVCAREHDRRRGRPRDFTSSDPNYPDQQNGPSITITVVS